MLVVVLWVKHQTQSTLSRKEEDVDNDYDGLAVQTQQPSLFYIPACLPLTRRLLIPRLHHSTSFSSPIRNHLALCLKKLLLPPLI